MALLQSGSLWMTPPRNLPLVDFEGIGWIDPISDVQAPFLPSLNRPFVNLQLFGLDWPEAEGLLMGWR